jgi:UDP-glucose 4-epimerase
MAHILLTGGTGFIGSHIVEALLAQGHQLRVLTSSSSIHPNIQPFRERLELLRGDFGNEQLMRQYLQSVEYLIHVAWTTVPKTATENPIYDAQSNLIGGLHLLEAAVAVGVKKVIFVSTGGALYGVPNYMPVDEDHPLQPISAYGTSKLAFERYLHFYYKNRGLDYTVFRIANAYGPRQNLTKNQGVIGIWLQKIQQGAPIEIWGDGSVVRDYIYVADVARLLVQSLTYQGAVKLFNVGSGQGYSLNEILQVCQVVSAQQPTVQYLEGRAFDVPVNVLSIERVQRVLGWSPSTALEAGIRATWDWLAQ